MFGATTPSESAVFCDEAHRFQFTQAEEYRATWHFLKVPQGRFG